MRDIKKKKCKRTAYNYTTLKIYFAFLTCFGKQLNRSLGNEARKNVWNKGSSKENFGGPKIQLFNLHEDTKK